jgi:bifunctional enzyme CysN/CysC
MRGFPLWQWGKCAVWEYILAENMRVFRFISATRFISARSVSSSSMTAAKNARANIKNQQLAILWITGLSSAGKATIAHLVEALLHTRDAHTIMFDGDNIRDGRNSDLGFTDADRLEKIRRIGDVGIRN